MSDHAEDLLGELARVAADLGPALRPVGHDELLASITETARRLFDAAACSLALLDDSEEELVFHVASGEGSRDVTGLRIPAGQGVAGWVVMSGQPISIEDVQNDPRFAVDVAETTGYVPRSILAMPLETERGTLGVIEVLDRRRGGAEGAMDMELLAVFARQAALAIESSRIFANLAAVLLQSVARATSDGGLGSALEKLAGDAPRPQADLAELALLFHELGRRGERERRTATRLAREFLDYVARPR